MPRGKPVLVALVAAFMSTIAAAQDMRSVDIRFAPGATGDTLSDTIVGSESVLYRVGAEAGQTLRVTLAPSNLATYFNVYAPGRAPGDEALANGQFTDPLNTWSGTLSVSGIYTISVYLMRSAARRDERSDYTMNVSVEGALGDVVQGDFADGLMGGPDVLRVQVSDGSRLNLRAAPSAGAAIVMTLPNGQSVRNLGCRMSEGRAWCQVATQADPGFLGWAAGDYLVE